MSRARRDAHQTRRGQKRWDRLDSGYRDVPTARLPLRPESHYWGDFAEMDGSRVDWWMKEISFYRGHLPILTYVNAKGSTFSGIGGDHCGCLTPMRRDYRRKSRGHR